MTHFSDADGPKGIDHQLKTFQTHSADLSGERSLCNSAGILRHAANPDVRGDWIRPGVMLYGASPDYPEHDATHWRLQPAMTLRTKIIGIQHIEAGDTVGYGSTFTASQPMRIGILACGYADGYPRHAPEGTPVLVGGERAPIIGRVSMDMINVDLSHLPHAVIGTEVTLWGQGPEHKGLATQLPIDEVAHHCGTIGYELMCALSKRVSILTVNPHQG